MRNKNNRKIHPNKNLKDKRRDNKALSENIGYAKRMIKLIDRNPNIVFEKDGMNIPGALSKMAYQIYIKEHGTTRI